MTFERVQQRTPEHSCQSTTAHQASLRMSNEVQVINSGTLNPQCRSEVGGSNREILQHAIDQPRRSFQTPGYFSPEDDRTDGGAAGVKFGAILDSRSSATDKLAAVRELSHSGISQVRFQGADGQNYAMRTETEVVGSREMVHLFITMPDGKERVVLRGIAKQDGSFEQERSANGKTADYYGMGAKAVSGCNPADAERSSREDDEIRIKPSGTPDLRPARTKSTDPGDLPSKQQNPSIYQRYRREQDRADSTPFNPFGDQMPPGNNGNGTLGKMMDEAQRAAHGTANQLTRTPLGIYMRARMDIDADGSPRARQIDPTGQTQTSMRYTDGSSINAEVVPYMVLPGGQYQQFGIKLGDMCLVRNKENGKMTIAVFADVGPRHKRGEGSMALANELGINASPTRGGVSSPSIEYLVLPGSGYPAKNQEQLMARINAQKQRLGTG